MICLSHMIIYTFKKMNTKLYSAASLTLGNPCHLFISQEEIVPNKNKYSAGNFILLLDSRPQMSAKFIFQSHPDVSVKTSTSS